MSDTTVLISGANRGLGLRLVQTFLSRPNHTVIGSVRDVAAARARGLEALPAAPGSKLVLVKIESALLTDPAKAVEELETLGITKLDIVIANAAVEGGDVLATSVGDLEAFVNTLTVNVVAPLALFKATYKLLHNAPNPKWASISTSQASLASHVAAFELMGQRPLGFSYGASKAALNHLGLSLHEENPRVTVLNVDPGFLDTDMGNKGAKHLGLEKPPHDPVTNARAIVELIEQAKRETHSGKFLSFEGKEVPW